MTTCKTTTGTLFNFFKIIHTHTEQKNKWKAKEWGEERNRTNWQKKKYKKINK